MQDQKIITRSSLYDLQSEYESDSSEYVAPKIDLEFIEIKSNSDGVGNEEENVIESMEEDKDDEFEFPLFASAMEVDLLSSDKIEDRGRSKEVGIMKVSLREQSEERIDNERPNSYYSAKYTDQEKKQFEQCSVTGDDIYKQIYIVDAQPWKCLDLNKHNAKVELELSRDKERKKKNRPGKKKREMKVACRQRKLERAKLKKLEEEEKKRQLKKQKYQRKSFGRNNSLNKKFNKSGGANKKPQQKQHAKPKYRTE